MRGQCVTGRTAGLASAIVLCGAISGQSFAQDAGKLPSQQEMWEMILRQQEEISELKQQVEAIQLKSSRKKGSANLKFFIPLC